MKGKALIAIKILLLLFICANSRKEDIACRAIRCMQGYRCEKGTCVMQKRKALKNVCVKPEFDGKIKAQRCQEQDRSKRCTQTRNVLSCGFGFNGLKYDFINDCSPCQDPKIFFYYRLPCSDAPIVCQESQQCINGKCVEMFDSDDDEDRNREICNSSSQCESDELCVANKCVGKRQLLVKLRNGRGRNK